MRRNSGENYSKLNKRRKKRRIIIGCLALIVALITVLALMLPADTLTPNTVNVYQVNKYSDAKTTLVYGGSVQDKLGTGMSFYFWEAVTVEKTWDGQLYIASYTKEDVSKLSLKAKTDGGFVLLLYNLDLDLEEMQKVTVDFDYSKNSGTSANGFGKIVFDSEKVNSTRRDNRDKLTVVEGVNTRDFIEVNLYDYGSNINENYEKDKSLPGFQQDNGTKSISGLGMSSFNFGNNITSDLSAGDTNVTKNPGINATADGANKPLSDVMSTTLKNGYPALKDGTSLDWLFSDGTYAKKKNKQSINGLFLRDEETGAYTFNSRANHAQFNSADDTFTLYKQMITSNFMMYPFGNFLPFNDIVHNAAQTSTVDRNYFSDVAQSASDKYVSDKQSEYNTLSNVLTKFSSLMDNRYSNGWDYTDCINEYFKAAGLNKTFDPDKSEFDRDLTDRLYSIDYDIETDFYFGMEMKMNFYQPKNGLTGNDGKQPMVFYFTGDDDVWVYVDGILFLDLSGIHRHVGGEIDFVNGTVKYYKLDVNTGDVAEEPYKTVKFSDLVDKSVLNEKGTFKDFSKHSFNFYYMERGSGSGVCRMNFNFPLLRENSVTVTKEIEANTALLGNPDFKFQVVKEGGNELYIGANIKYDVLDAKGNFTETKTTDANGVFTLKAGQTAVFDGIKENLGRYFVRELLDDNTFAQYGEIKVDGSIQTENYGTVVGEDVFTGINSPVKDISDGSTVFHFNNVVDVSKLGKLTLLKTVADCPSDVLNTEFVFHIAFDGIPVKAGTIYTVNGEIRTVETEGTIKLKHGEKALFEGILAGSQFKISEADEFLRNYSVKYTLDGQVQAENYVTGIIKNSTQAEITVNNTEIGVQVEIHVKKELRDPDGKEYSFTFLLEQVTDISGEVLFDPPVKREITVNITDEAQNAKFIINYPLRTLNGQTQKFYYRITEKATDGGNIEYDKSVYTAEVTVENNGEEPSANVSILKEGGVSVNDGTVAFVNRVLRYELPSTGGSGLTGYFVLGLALIISSFTGILISYKRKDKISASI